MKAVRMSPEQLHRLGARPDGKGGVVRLPAAEWEAKHAPAPPPPKPAIRVPRSRLPNATEQRWLMSARARWPMLDIRYEAISFRLSSGANYRPDFSGWNGARLVWVCEVKGAWKYASHSRSILAFKTAASEWPQITFLLAQRKDGEWLETAIGPVR